MDVAVAARIRHQDIVAFSGKDGRVVSAHEQAVDPRRGYVVGLMFLDHTITKRQHDALVKYAEDMARFYGLTGIQFPSARAQDLFAVRSDGDDPEGRVLAAQAARHRAKSIQSVLLACGDINTGRRVEHTVKSVALLDIAESRKWPTHMIAWLRQGANAMAEYYRIPS